VVVGWGYGRGDVADENTSAGPTLVTHAATVEELRGVLGV
jgi:phosphoglycolate phosphatase